MRSTIRRLGTFLIGIGIDPRKSWAAVRSLPGYISGLVKYIRASAIKKPMAFPIRVVPVLSDRYLESGVARGHYFHQDLWAAREIFKRRPTRHIDVGSRVDGFVAHLLCFREVEVIDIRPLSSTVQGLSFLQADISQPGAVRHLEADSVSCLHALEHFGLGRYGDPIQPDGWRHGLQNLVDLLLPEGTLFLSVPVGKEHVEFNAQRIFNPLTILSEAQKLGLYLERFSAVDDTGDFHEGVAPESAAAHDFGCGCFVFRKG